MPQDGLLHNVIHNDIITYLCQMCHFQSLLLAGWLDGCLNREPVILPSQPGHFKIVGIKTLCRLESLNHSPAAGSAMEPASFLTPLLPCAAVREGAAALGRVSMTGRSAAFLSTAGFRAAAALTNSGASLRRLLLVARPFAMAGGCFCAAAALTNGGASALRMV
jgi:glucose-6-phosphate dehydrogenase assembly protein OpcA